MKIVIPRETVKLDSPIGRVPQRQFRYEWTLELTTDQYAEKIVIDPEESQLLAKFLPYSFDIKSTDLIPSTLVKKDDKTVIVTLDQPLRIKSIHFDESITGNVELYRMDGDAIAPDPTVTQTINSSVANVITDEFTAAKFAIRLSNNNNLAPDDIQQLYLQSYPTTASIGFLDTRQGSGSVVSLVQPDASATGLIGFLAGNSTALTAPVQRYLNSLPRPFPKPLTLTIVATSDTPCVLNIQSSLSYYLKRETFFSAAPASATTLSAQDKQTLRFTGATLTPQTLDIQLPPNSKPRTASIRFADSTQPADPLITANSLAVRPEFAPPPTQSTGIQATTNHWVGQRFTPETAQRIDGLLLGLLPLQADTQLTLELQTDADGVPSGETLVSTPIKLQAIGKRRWYTLTLDALTLDARPYWWLLSARQGSAVWTTVPNTTESAETSAYLFCREASTQVFETLQHYAKQTAMFQLKQVVTGSDGKTVSQDRESAIAFRLNNTELPATRENNNIEVNLLSALSPVPADAKLSIAVSRPSILTAYAPIIEYDLQT